MNLKEFKDMLGMDAPEKLSKNMRVIGGETHIICEVSDEFKSSGASLCSWKTKLTPLEINEVVKQKGLEGVEGEYLGVV